MSDSDKPTTLDAPAGLEIGQITRKLFSKGDDDWRELNAFKKFTNVFICDKKNGRILLGMKKRGFGKGLFNGFGGKVEPNETPLEGAARELKEESGITAKLEECAILLFVNASTEYCHYVHMFRAHEYEGEPIETEEMKPQWFAIPSQYLDKNEPGKQTFTLGPDENRAYPPIPLATMWPDDELWMPLLLQGTNFVGRVDFGLVDTEAQKGSWVMERWWFGARD